MRQLDQPDLLLGHVQQIENGRLDLLLFGARVLLEVLVHGVE